MGNLVKAALIVAAAIVVATGMTIYFSPYHSCMRSGWFTEVACAGRR